ncbi:MAG: hypothetical protein P8M27_04475 [Flavobacteriaceae bacterium]|nr:hypothetical protein [Flavobacteriaceae bacterium]
MKKIFFTLTLTLLTVTFSFSQAHIGVMGGYDIDMEKTQVGMGLNYMLFPKVSIGGMVMLSDLELSNLESSETMLMLNAKYHFGRISLVAGVMDGGSSPAMGMNMASMNGSDDKDAMTYFGFEYKPFKNKKLKVYYNHSDMMKSFGVMLPIFNLGKKMHMNH